MRAGVHKPTYSSWSMMKNRCLNPNAEDAAYYGARGITVCDKWMTYDGFLADMGERPGDRTLDRRDNNKGYDPDNCHWATKSEQSRNRDYTRDVTYQGRTQKTWQWADELKVKFMTFHHRLWRFSLGRITEDEVFAANRRRS